MFFQKRVNKVFFVIAIIITLPILLLEIIQPISGESGLIFFPHMIAGLPWVLLYLTLPFDIPGLTSACQAEGCMVGIFEIILLYIPVYINLYILSRFLIKE